MKLISSDYKLCESLRLLSALCGCCFLIIFFSCNSISASKEITYSEHIAPIIYKHCTTCHRPGSAGTFNLLTYEDAKRRAKTIQLVTQSRLMPPFPADVSYSHFRDEKVMSDEEISMIKQWVEDGTPLGDTTKL